MECLREQKREKLLLSWGFPSQGMCVFAEGMRVGEADDRL